jgi:hypothetical protein
MNYFRLTTCFAIAAALMPFAHAQAATISFDPQETTVGSTSPFEVGITIDADAPVNAIRAVIDIPASMDVLDASDGNSVINLWVERPHVTGNQVIFAGIIPGGFTGVKGKLITLTLTAHKGGKRYLIVDPSSRVYENGPDAAEQPIVTSPLELTVSGTKDNIANPLPDTVPPEAFAPVLTSIPGDSGPAWAVSFETQDKQSGIASYEVAESRSHVSLSSKSKLESLSWKPAESPYILPDQGLSSYIYVKATDQKGNERFAYLSAQHPVPWYVSAGGYILIAIIAAFVLYLFRRFVRITRR